jgi:hypothetical protein
MITKIKEDNDILECEVYYEDDFGYKPNVRCNLDDANAQLFGYLENILYSRKTYVVPLSICFGFIASCLFSDPCQAEVMMRKTGAYLNSITLDPVVVESVEAVLIKPRSRGRRLGHYFETTEAKIIFKVFEIESARQALKLIPTLSITKPLPTMAFKNFSKSHLKNIVTGEVFVSHVIPMANPGMNSLWLSCLKVTSCLVILPSITDFIPLPPGSRVLLSLLNRGRKHFFKDTGKREPMYENSNFNEFDIARQLFSSAGRKISRMGETRSNSGKKFAFLPGTVVLFLLAIFKRKTFDTAVTTILETSGLTSKKTSWQKVVEFVKLANQRNVYVFVISGGVIVVAYLNREKIFSTVAKVREGDGITLGFDHLNTVFTSYVKYATSTVENAQKMSADALNRVWRHQDLDLQELKFAKTKLEESRLENRKLQDEIYTLGRSVDRNAMYGNLCQKELSNLQLENDGYRQKENDGYKQKEIEIDPAKDQSYSYQEQLSINMKRFPFEEHVLRKREDIKVEKVPFFENLPLAIEAPSSSKTNIFQKAGKLISRLTKSKKNEIMSMD